MLIAVIIVMIVSLFLILAIRKGILLSAGEVVSNYLSAILSGRTEEAYRHLSSPYKARHALSDYQANHSLGNGLIANMIARGITFTVERTDVEGDEATVMATTTAPDFRLMMGDVCQGMAAERIPERNLDAFVFICREIGNYLHKYRREAVPLKTCPEIFHLIREKDGWKVRLEE